MIEQLLKLNVRAELARRHFLNFIEYTNTAYKTNWHHKALAEKLEQFAKGKIKRLMVFMPPQHGKSEQTSRRLPPYLLGINPRLKIAGCSYNADLAKAFNRDVQRVIDDQLYFDVFPATRLSSGKDKYTRNADFFDVVDYGGFYKSVGVGGPLTGTPVDIGIIDDPVKDAVEAKSITYQNRVWEWYTQVFLTRLHNNSQQLLTMTRWDPGDLAGRILDQEADKWEVLRLEAIREDTRNQFDPRELGQALWPERHSLQRLQEAQQRNPLAFRALYQQDPQAGKGLLIYPDWQVFSGPQEVEEVYYGLDFGFANPTALVEVGVYGQKVYIRERLYAKDMTPSDLLMWMQSSNLDRRRPIFCDSNREDIITELRRAGWDSRAVIKGQDSVDYGISLVKQYELNVSDDSPNVQYELQNYIYKQDASGKSTGIPRKENDHALDAVRYVIRMISGKPKKPTYRRVT